MTGFGNNTFHVIKDHQKDICSFLFLAAKSSSRSWFLVSDSNAGLNCNVMSIRMIDFDHSIFPELVTQTTLHWNVMSFSVLSDCLSVVNVDHTDGHYKHYMSHYNPISYKHVESHQGITLMDITCLFITLFHINMLDFPLGITLKDIACFIITWWTLQIPQLYSFLTKFIIFISIYFDKDTREVYLEM